MGSASRRWALNLVIHARGDELRDEVTQGLPTIVKLVLEVVELRPGDAELLADAVITDLDGTEARLGVASFTLDELAARYPNLDLAVLCGGFQCTDPRTIESMIELPSRRYRLFHHYRDTFSFNN